MYKLQIIQTASQMISKYTYFFHTKQSQSSPYTFQARVFKEINHFLVWATNNLRGKVGLQVPEMTHTSLD